MTDWFVADIADRSAIGDARRGCARLASRHDFDENTAGRVAIVATELASNLVRHGSAAQRFFARAASRQGRCALEMVAVDGGTGMADPGAALRDGFSTAGTPGTGLGAVRRLSDEFDFYTQPAQGTAVLSRIVRPAADVKASAAALDTGVFATPYPGETVCGDDWVVLESGERTTIVVADGLGHGVDAAAASAAAIRVAQRLGGAATVVEHLREMHVALRDTRGAAVGIAIVRPATRELAFAGVGNISAVLISPDAPRTLITLDGIVGHASPNVRQYDYPFPESTVLVMHSDGIRTRWQLEDYPGLALKDPALIAAVLHRDAVRGRDDAVVLAARSPGAPPAV